MNQNFEAPVMVERVLSQLEGGCIFTATREDGRLVRIKFIGRGMRPMPGETIRVKGILTTFHDRFGGTVQQVVSKRMNRAPSMGVLLGPWLRRLPNIGTTRAQRLLSAYGHDLLAVLKEPSRMPEVANILEPDKPALATKIAASVYSAMALEAGAQALKSAEVEFLIYLEKLGIADSKVAIELWRLMAGEQAIERLQRNSYLPALFMDWKTADRIGQSLLRSSESKDEVATHPARLMGALNSVWREILGSGDTACSCDVLEHLLSARNVDSGEAIKHAERSGVLKHRGSTYRVPGAAWLEDQVAARLVSVEASQCPVLDTASWNRVGLIEDAERASQIQLTDEQRKAVEKLLQKPVAVLYGGAGVGKTTVMKVLSEAWELLGGNVVLTALAGKAALMLSRGASSPGRPRLAYTIARLTGLLEERNELRTSLGTAPLFHEVELTSWTLLIVDEAGMVDTPSLHRILRLLPNGARILLSGDHGQLPPVGIGQVFYDLVRDGTRAVGLTKILRQADDSAIPYVSNDVRNGRVPPLRRWTGERQGVFSVSVGDFTAIQQKLHRTDDVIVIAAKRATVASINEAAAWEHHKSGAATRRLNGLVTVAVGDPVVATANRYQDGLFNGLLGVVTSVESPQVMVRWDGELESRAISEQAAQDLELAYGITCHKAQGSSARVAVVIVEHTPFVTREWLYTAITRGRELVLLVGDEQILSMAVGRRTTRTTGFSVPPVSVG